MIPKSFSATAMQVGMACPARYNAEFIERAPQFAGSAAGLGSALHNALEDFVRGVKIRKDLMWSLDVLMDLYDKSFAKIFGADRSIPEYKDGKAILNKWYARPYIFADICGSQTLSLEHKDSFDIPVVIDGVKTKKPFNFIIDRLDRLGEGEYRVVDYKSQRLPVTPDELYSKLQARAYAVAVAIKYKDAQKIWVEFDLLRHEKVAAVFTRNDNIDSWRMMCSAAQDIIDTPAEKAPEKLNTECMYCVRKATCATLVKNSAVGGIMSLSIDDAALKMAEIQVQIKALGYLAGDLEKQLLLHAAEHDVLSFDTQYATVKVTSFGRRSFDEAKVAAIVGSDILARYGRLNLSTIDELLKGSDITDGQKAALQAAIIKKPTEPGIKVVKK